MPPGQTNAGMDGHPAEARMASVDHSERTNLHPGALAVHRITRRTGGCCRPSPGAGGRRLPAAADHQARQKKPRFGRNLAAAYHAATIVSIAAGVMVFGAWLANTSCRDSIL